MDCIAACAHEPLNSHSFWLFWNWLNEQGLQPTVPSLCTWKSDRAVDLPSLNAMLAADGRDPLDDRDFEAFQRWNGDGPMHEESVGDWENSPEGEQWCLHTKSKIRCRGLQENSTSDPEPSGWSVGTVRCMRGDF